jgi:hypothetical protein
VPFPEQRSRLEKPGEHWAIGPALMRPVEVPIAVAMVKMQWSTCSQTHLDGSINDAYFVRGRGFGRGHAHGRPSTHIETGTMPWADETMVFKLPFSQWSAIVRADIVKAIVIITKSHDDDIAIVNFRA